MGCICSEVVYSAKDENALEQPYKSGQQFLGTSGRDDMVVELDSGSDGPDDDGRLISEGNKENVVASQIILPEFGDKKHVVAEKSELHVAQRPKKIYIEGNVRVHSIKVIADGVQNICEWLSWLTSVARDSTKARFLQMPLSKDELDKGAILGDSRKFCFLPVHVKRGMTNVQSNEYLEESSNHYIIRYGDDMDRSRKLLLKEDPAYLGVDVAFLDDLAEEVRSYNVLAFKVSGNKDWWLYSLLNQCSIPRVDAVFISCVTKFISERNACYLPESASFLAPDSGNLFFLLASDFLFIDSLSTFCITITGTSIKMHIKDTVIGPYNEQCISAISNTSESVESVLMRALRVLQQDSLVIEALKETNFVTNANGDLYKPKDLFDPGDSLLTSVFSSDVHKFPRERFATDGWLNILRKTGLQNTGDTDIVLECVRRVELLGSKSMNPLGLVDDCNMEDSLDTRAEVSLEIWSLAETLITAIFEIFSVLYGNKFCNILGKIACIPAKRGKKRVLCSYSEAILMKDWALAWSSSPVLFRESLVPPEYSWEALQLRSPPHFDRVLKHLQAGLLSDSTLSNLEESTFEVLKYLDSIWPTLSSSDILELKQVAFIAVDNGTHLVTSGSLFTHLSKNLSPLASKIPPGYVPFVKILRELGSEDKLCVSTAINILLRLQNSCDRLNPNELHAVIEILDFLCNETIEQQTSDRPTWQSELVVPDDGCRFVHANSSVYIDRYGSQYVKFIDSSQLRFVHRDVSERMCLAFGIRKLSDVVVEELDCDKRLQTREEIGSVSLAAIKQKLLSWSFQVAVSRVFYTVSSSTIGSENPDFQTIQRSLKFVSQRLQFVRCIYTRFRLLPKNLEITHVSESIVPEWGSGSSHRALYYVDRSNTCMLIGEPPSYVSLIDLVSIVVSIVLGSPVPLPIGSLFQCLKESETALVNILKLSSNSRVMESVGRGIDFLGRELHPEDENKAEFNNARPFHKGEIVAWVRKKAEKLKYGRIVEDVLARKTLSSFNLETFPGKTEAINSSFVAYFPSFSVGKKNFAYVISEEGDHVVSSMLIQQPDQSAKVKARNQVC